MNNDLIVRSKVMFEPSSSVKFILAGDYSSQFGSLPVTLQQRPGLENVGFYEKCFTNRLQPNPALDLPLINHGGDFHKYTSLLQTAEDARAGPAATVTITYVQG